MSATTLLPIPATLYSRADVIKPTGREVPYWYTRDLDTRVHIRESVSANVQPEGEVLPELAF
ncbi:hypothetical protein GCM10009682_42590 [Luedemannella flava]|uniref:Uncharacterized protein n=1 Tax=Luedemannella flava TaxID=349316 RepID=A0ABN2MAJ6_9ACTN